MTLGKLREMTKDSPDSSKIKIWVQNAPSGMSRAIIDSIDVEDDGIDAFVYFLGDDQEF